MFDQSIKKMEYQKSRVTNPLVFFQMIPKSMQDVYTSKYIPILIKHFLKINAVILNLLAIIEKMETSRDNKQFCAAVLTDFSKVFDCVCYYLLIPKLNAYGFDKKALKLIYDYLNGSFQKIQVGSSFSGELNIPHGVPQGSIHGPLLFNIDICDLFFVDINSNTPNYTDTPLLSKGIMTDK